jgi:hypothetical protein
MRPLTHGAGADSDRVRYRFLEPGEVIEHLIDQTTDRAGDVLVAVSAIGSKLTVEAGECHPRPGTPGYRTTGLI